MTEEIHPLHEIIKQQSAEIARLQGHIKHIGNDALRSELERKDALLRDALAAWTSVCVSYGWESDHLKEFSKIKEELE